MTARARRLPAAVLGLLLLAAFAAAQEATLAWQGQTYKIAASGADFRIADAAKALGFAVAADPATGVLTLTGHGHKVLVGAGTAQVPVDQRLVSISRPAQTISGALYAPTDFFEKVLFPLVGAAGSYDAVKRVWTLAEAKALAVDVAVVHVEAATQVVLRQSGPAKSSRLPARRRSRSAGPTEPSRRPSPRRNSRTPSSPPSASPRTASRSRSATRVSRRAPTR